MMMKSFQKHSTWPSFMQGLVHSKKEAKRCHDMCLKAHNNQMGFYKNPFVRGFSIKHRNISQDQEGAWGITDHLSDPQVQNKKPRMPLKVTDLIVQAPISDSGEGCADISYDHSTYDQLQQFEFVVAQEAKE